jgi:hypothetical protein
LQLQDFVRLAYRTLHAVPGQQHSHQRSHLLLYYPLLYCPLLFCPLLFCPLLYCPLLYCPLLHCPLLYRPLLPFRPAVSALQARCSFVVSPALVREALTEAEAVAGRVVDLADAAHEAFLTQPLLTAVCVRGSSAGSAAAAAAAGGSNAGSGGGSSGGCSGRDVDGGEGAEGVERGEGEGVLVLTLVEPDVRVKVEVALKLRELLAHAHPGEQS